MTERRHNAPKYVGDGARSPRHIRRDSAVLLKEAKDRKRVLLHGEGAEYKRALATREDLIAAGVISPR